jgi:ABC-type sugar transport system permease subunit
MVNQSDDSDVVTMTARHLIRWLCALVVIGSLVYTAVLLLLVHQDALVTSFKRGAFLPLGIIAVAAGLLWVWLALADDR